MNIVCLFCLRSIPVFKKIGSYTEVVSFGNWPINCFIGYKVSILQSIHFERTFFMFDFACIIQ